jgi:hypothetical protein
MRRTLNLALFLLILLCLLVLKSFAINDYALLAYLLDQNSRSGEINVGDVDTSYRIYFVKDSVETEASEVVVSENPLITKKGVYFVNVTDNRVDEFIQNLRIAINVDSNVDTYLRVKLIKTMVLITVNYLGHKTEIPIVTEDVALNYDATSWFLAPDGYFYLKEKTQRNEDASTRIIPLIIEYFPNIHFNPLPIGHSVQISLEVEAVQALLGPQLNWGLTNPPWGGTW